MSIMRLSCSTCKKKKMPCITTYVSSWRFVMPPFHPSKVTPSRNASPPAGSS